MVQEHHWFSGHVFEQTLGDGEGNIYISPGFKDSGQFQHLSLEDLDGVIHPRVLHGSQQGDPGEYQFMCSSKTQIQLLQETCCWEVGC